jgi:hypothetical protein
MADNINMTAVSFVLAAFYGGCFSIMMSRADIWFPFTPTFTATPGRWVGWQDALRWALSGIFLILLPAAYLLCLILVLTQEPAPLTFDFTPFPSLWSITKFVVIMSLVAPQLGFYDLWQALMCALPKVFYSPDAVPKIQKYYPNAFKTGRRAAVAWGLFWFSVPTTSFIFILWIEKI